MVPSSLALAYLREERLEEELWGLEDVRVERLPSFKALEEKLSSAGKSVLLGKADTIAKLLEAIGTERQDPTVLPLPLVLVAPREGLRDAFAEAYRNGQIEWVEQGVSGSILRLRCSRQWHLSKVSAEVDRKGALQERLDRQQRRLLPEEKQALVSEIAGSAAHMLNQPLTSVMGYAELLRRRLPQGPALRAADTIVREAERMAAVVRKLSQVTEYETKDYVGEQRILDLDRSAEGSDPSPEL